MINLIGSEWQRIRLLVFLAFAGNAMVLAVLANYGLLLVDNLGLNVVLTSAYGFAALAFGVHQVRNYSQGAGWVFLINRPTSTARIFVSLLLAASMLFIVALLVPWLVALIAMKTLSSNVIESRHFLVLPYLFGVAKSFYLAGACFALSRNVWMAFLLWLPILSIVSLHVGGNVFALLVAVIVLMISLTLIFFKPALGIRPTKWWEIGIVALAIQVSSFMSITAITETTQQIIVQNFPNNGTPKESGAATQHLSYQQVSRLNGKEKVVKGLSGLPALQRDAIARIVRTGQVYQVKKAVSFLPTRWQMPFVYSRSLQLSDPEREIVWEFSHDTMQFVGRNRSTGKKVGRMGPHGTKWLGKQHSNVGRFSQVPWIAGQQFACGNSIYRFNERESFVDLIFELPENQHLQAPLNSRGPLFTLLSDRELYLFEGVEVRKGILPYRAFAKIELPDDYNNLRDISFVELRDDYLFSFLFGKDPRTRAYEAAQFTYRVSRDGGITKLHQCDLERDSSPVLRYLPSLISPVVDWALDLFPFHPGRDRYLPKRASVYRFPAIVLRWIVLLAFINVAFTFWLARKRGLKLAEAIAWSVTNGLTGAPGLISFFALTKGPKSDLCDRSGL